MTHLFANAVMRTRVRAPLALIAAMAAAFAVAAQSQPSGVGVAADVSALQSPVVASSADGGTYTGALVNGRFHGRGRLVWPHGGFYEGNFAEGLFHGRGRLKMPTGEVLEGEFVRGQMDGRARMQGAHGFTYAGEVKAFQFHGHGRFERDGEVYEGAFEAGRYSGFGRLVTDGAEYNGHFRDGMKHGSGIARLRKGGAYAGEWAKDFYEGHGEWRKDGEVYRGQFKKGRFEGVGVHDINGSFRYEGGFADGSPKGHGRMADPSGTVYLGSFGAKGMEGAGRITWPDGRHYEGEVQNYEPQGHGQMRLPNGDVYRGAFQYGEFDGEGEMVYAKPVDGRTLDRGQWAFGNFKPRMKEERLRDTKVVEQALYAQPALLDRALADLKSSDPAGIHMYLLALAGDGAQEVFRRETEFVQQQFDTSFGTRGRSVRLVNSRSTPLTLPMASATSVQRALDTLAAKMDRDKDILFLYVTSHGSSDHELSLGLRGMDLPPLKAKDLSTMLTNTGIRWKVIVISACYAGGFVEALRNERTLVIAAARHDRRSFGCADENDFTYFGRAFFKEALPASDSFQAAFRRAEQLVGQWEARDRDRVTERKAMRSERRARPDSSAPTDEGGARDTFKPSLPQMADAEPIAAHLRQCAAAAIGVRVQVRDEIARQGDLNE